LGRDLYGLDRGVPRVDLSFRNRHHEQLNKLKEHVWVQLREFDSCQCEVCGLVASNTAIACRVGIPTTVGWVSGEGSQYLPECRERELEVDPDLDAEMALLLAGELPPAA
jgi:hypothetical protein